MPETEQREIAESLFDRDQTREEIKNAMMLEEARRAAIVKNLFRLRALRLSSQNPQAPNNARRKPPSHLIRMAR
jgi:hypothetical protein